MPRLCWYEVEVSAMVDPINIQNLFLGTISGAAIVLMGAFYALFFALGRLHASSTLAMLALVAYALLAVAVTVLAVALEFSGFWISLAGALLIGYFLAPRAIWRLCVGTHGEDETEMKKGAAR